MTITHWFHQRCIGWQLDAEGTPTSVIDEAEVELDRRVVRRVWIVTPVGRDVPHVGRYELTGFWVQFSPPRIDRILGKGAGRETSHSSS